MNQRSIIYSLKRQHGKAIQIVIPGDAQVDPLTGNIYTDDSVINVRRALVLNAKTIRDFEYDLSFIAANKNFTYGGFFDVRNRVVVVDAQDTFPGYEPTLNHRLIFENRNWQVMDMETSDSIIRFLVHSLEGSPLNES
jgi:hypothetical protein